TDASWPSQPDSFDRRSEAEIMYPNHRDSSQSRRFRAARRHRVAAARLDDGAPRESDEPDGDERAAARDAACRPSARSRALTSTNARQTRATLDRRQLAAG